jgi:aspartate aminotransferase-like enzyme
MIRIGTLGFVSEPDLVRCLRALGRTLALSGHSPVDGVSKCEPPALSTTALS